MTLDKQSLRPVQRTNVKGNGVCALLRLRIWVESHFPPGQFGRYLVVGFCNTVFGYSTFALFTAILTPHIPLAYVVASFLAGFFNFTFAYLTYKRFIFKTRGNYLREWLRCVTVYGLGLVIGASLLPFVVFAIRHLTPAGMSAPYFAGALMMGINVVLGFLGHKNFSFAPSRDFSRESSVK